MTVVVTGATGFIGRGLREQAQHGPPLRLAVRAPISLPGEDVRVVGPLEALAAGESRAAWAAALRGADAVIHVAGRAHAFGADARDAAAFRRVNVDATVALAREAARAGVGRFVFLSTVKVNGERTTDAPYTERDAPHPEGLYAESKLEAERRLWAVAEEEGIACTVVRTPLVYGPGVRANFLSLLRAVDRGVPLPLGSIRNARSLVYVRNLAHALLHVATHPSAAGETFLVKDGPDLSTPELVRKLAAALGRSPRLVPVPPALLQTLAGAVGRADAARRLLGSLAVSDAHLRHRTAWAPPATADDGIAATAHWYRSEREQRAR